MKEMNPILKELINYLSNGQFHTGEQLGQCFGITRSAIWKLIQQIRDLGIEIESMTRRGYRIPGGLNVLNVEKIKTYVSSDFLRCIEAIEIFNQIESTNDYLMQKAVTSYNRTSVCLAEQQSRGKGRLGRTWLSPFGVNIYFSMCYPFARDISELAGLSLVVATIVTRVLSKIGIQEHIGLKWPNDLLWKNRKLGGILIEISGEAHGMNHAVIGIGINVSMSKNRVSSIDQPWVSLCEIDTKATDRNKIVGLLIDQLMQDLSLFQEKGFSVFHRLFQSLDVLVNQPIQVSIGSKIMEGVSCGVDNQGRLLFKDSSGHPRVFSSGDVSIRKKRV